MLVHTLSPIIKVRARSGRVWVEVRVRLGLGCAIVAIYGMPPEVDSWGDYTLLLFCLIRT